MKRQLKILTTFSKITISIHDVCYMCRFFFLFFNVSVSKKKVNFNFDSCGDVWNTCYPCLTGRHFQNEMSVHSKFLENQTKVFFSYFIIQSVPTRVLEAEMTCTDEQG